MSASEEKGKGRSDSKSRLGAPKGADAPIPVDASANVGAQTPQHAEAPISAEDSMNESAQPEASTPAGAERPKRAPKTQSPPPPLGPVIPSPVGILTWLLLYGNIRVPGIANALLIFLLVLIVASAISLISNIPYAVFGILVAIFLLPFASFFGPATRRQKSLREQVFEHVSLGLGIGSIILLFLSFFFDWPLPLKQLLVPSLPEIPVAAPDVFELNLPQEFRDWATKHVGDPGSAVDETNAQKYLWFYHLGRYYIDGDKSKSPDVYVIKSKSIFDNNYDEFTRKLTLPELKEGEQPVGAGFIVYDDSSTQLPRFVPLTFQRVEQRGEAALQFTVTGAKRGGQFLILCGVPKGTRIGPKAFQIVRDWAR